MLKLSRMGNAFLFKSEPHVYSIDLFAKDKKTNWDHVRNYQARNVLRACKKGDQALIYHSGDEKAVVGLALVIKEAYPDLDSEKAGDWVQIDLKFVQKFKTPVTLATIKKTLALKDLPLIKQSRLSCMPVTKKDFDLLIELGGA